MEFCLAAGEAETWQGSCLPDPGLGNAVGNEMGVWGVEEEVVEIEDELDAGTEDAVDAETEEESEVTK
jgi:hypothetical protein